MAYRQYVGARYVPLFDGAWDATKNYEPLTVVEDGNGNSYTSKKDVPAGTPLTDRNYWILTASFSGAVQQLQNRVTQAEMDIDAVKAGKKTNGRKYILIGDSFSYGIIGSGIQWDQNGWAVAAKRFLPDDVFIYDAASGSISAHGGFGGDVNFTDVLDIIDVPDESQITDIVVLSGTNDTTFTRAQINTGISDFCALARSKYPNAKVRIGVLGTDAVKNAELIAAYKDCRTYGAAYIDSTLNLLCDRSYVSDGTHLTSAGYAFYLPYILTAVFTGSVDYCFTIKCPVSLRSGAGLTMPLSQTPAIIFEITPDNVRCRYGNPDAWNDFQMLMETSDLSTIAQDILDIASIPIFYRTGIVCMISVPILAHGQGGDYSRIDTYKNIALGIASTNTIRVLNFPGAFIPQASIGNPARYIIAVDYAMQGESSTVS